MNEIGFDIKGDKNFSYRLDDVRLSYFYSEIDSLISIFKIIEFKAYKESFILLRAVFEKCLFFWLMLEGKKYRWTEHHIIKQKSGEDEKIEDKRDRLYQEWFKEWKSGNPKFKDVIDIQPN